MDTIDFELGSNVQCSLLQEVLDLAGGNQDVYDALIAQVFARFEELIGVSPETEYDWNIPTAGAMGPPTVRRVNEYISHTFQN